MQENQISRYLRRANYRGFTYIGLMIFVVLLGIGLALASQVWHTAMQREKEKELLFVGNQFQSAIAQYYEGSPGGVKKFPASLEDLLSNYFLERGNPEAAVGALQEGLKILPADAALSFRLAEAYRLAGKAEDAIAAYEEMVKRDPGNDLASNNLASMLVDVRQDKASHERAKTLAQRFERSANPAYLDTLGWVDFKLGDYTQAVLLLNRATERAPQVAIFQFHLGMALHRRGDVALARPYLQKAVESKAQIPGIEEARKILAAG